MTEATAQNNTDAAASGSSAAAAPTGDAGTAAVDQASSTGVDTSTGGEGGEAAAAAAPASAPEQYGAFDLPEGYQLEESELAQFSEWAKSNNLTQEAAQLIINRDAQRMTDAMKAADDAWSSTVTGWQTQVKNDSELGGANYEQNLGIANKAVEAFGNPALRAFLDESGLGNHPELIRAFYKAGVAISEDRLVSGGNGEGRPASAYYSNSNLK